MCFIQTSWIGELQVQRETAKIPKKGENQSRKTSKLAFGLQMQVYTCAVHAPVYTGSHMHTNVHLDK